MNQKINENEESILVQVDEETIGFLKSIRDSISDEIDKKLKMPNFEADLSSIQKGQKEIIEKLNSLDDEISELRMVIKKHNRLLEKIDSLLTKGDTK